MTETISFTEIVKLIHPDHNPSLNDFGGKMRNAKLYRDDEDTLYKLGVSWGVIVSDKTFTEETATPAPSATEQLETDYRARKLQGYRDLIAKQDQKKRDAKRDSNHEKNEYFKFRVRNRIFQDGDIVYIRTKGGNVKITKITDTRVYFFWNGKTSYAAKKNVRFTRQM